MFETSVLRRGVGVEKVSSALSRTSRCYRFVTFDRLSNDNSMSPLD